MRVESLQPPEGLVDLDLIYTSSKLRCKTNCHFCAGQHVQEAVPAPTEAENYESSGLGAQQYSVTPAGLAA